MRGRSAVFALLAAVGVLVAWSAVSRPALAAGATLTEAEVIRIAEQAAQDAGYDLARYDRTGCHYEYTRKDQTWTVFFQQKPPTPPGGHFLVSVDDRTKKATLARGE